MNSTPKKNALLLVGGGARAAYQAGVLRSLAKAFPQLQFPVLAGVSAGAINAASLANATDDFPQAVERTVGYWDGVTIDQIFNTDFHHSSFEALKWGIRMATAHPPPFKGMLDTAPLRRFLCRSLESPDGILHGIGANLRSGRLSAFGITTAQYPSGQTTTWFQGREVEPWHRAHRCGKSAALSVEHIMASTALPLVFPAVQLEDGWHGDGGLRLISPLSPALHLGADRILAISTLLPPGRPAAIDLNQGYPSLGSLLNVLLDSVFLDTLEANAGKIRQINQMIADHPRRAEFGFRPVEVLVVRPSVDLGAIACEFVDELPKMIRRILRGLGSSETTHANLIATLLFQPRYVRRLLEIGEKDGDSRREEFAAFFGFDSQHRTPGAGALAFRPNGTHGLDHHADRSAHRDHAIAAERTGTDG